MAGIPDFLAMNVTKAPFDKKEVRQAIAWAIDRKAIQDIAYFGSGEVGVQEVASGSPWYDGVDPYAAGPDLAQGQATARRRRLPERPDDPLPRPAAVSGAAEDRRDRRRAAQADRHHDADRAGRRLRLVRPVLQGRLRDHSAYQERTIDPDNFYSLVVKTGGPSTR